MTERLKFMILCVHYINVSRTANCFVNELANGSQSKFMFLGHLFYSDTEIVV